MAKVVHKYLTVGGGGAVYNRYKYNILITDFHFAKLEIIVFKTARVMIYL